MGATRDAGIAGAGGRGSRQPKSGTWWPGSKDVESGCGTGGDSGSYEAEHCFGQVVQGDMISRRFVLMLFS